MEFAFGAIKYLDLRLQVRTSEALYLLQDFNVNTLQYEKQTRLINSKY